MNLPFNHKGGPFCSRLPVCFHWLTSWTFLQPVNEMKRRAFLFRNNLFAHLLSALSKNPFNYMQPLLEQPIPIHATTGYFRTVRADSRASMNVLASSSLTILQNHGNCAQPIPPSHLHLKRVWFTTRLYRGQNKSYFRAKKKAKRELAPNLGRHL